MRIQLFHSSILRILFYISNPLFSTYIITFSHCAAAYDPCPGLFYNCGSLKGIGYPFWGSSRHQSCGIRPLHLVCVDNNDTLLIIDTAADPFIVLSIEQSSNIMTIARYDLWNDICPQRFTNISWLDLEVLQYNVTEPLHQLIIFYGCSSKANTSTSSILVPSNVTCSVHGERSPVVFAANDVKQIQGCSISIVVPVKLEVHDELWDGKIAPHDAVKQGFNVGYGKLTAACKDSNYQSYCPSNSSGRSHGIPQRSDLAGKNRRMKLATGISAAGVGIVVICLVIWFCKVKKPSKGFSLLRFKGKGNDGQNLDALIEQFGFLAPKRYRYSDIKKMTISFRDKLGSGGYGDVYKGNLFDGSPVAVKILNASKGNGEDFVNEIASISRTSHVNIVTLLGFCLDGQKRALVYEFMPNGSLEKYIHGETTQKTNCRLEWDNLYQIALGVARGLEYLHRGCSTRILHFDIKPHNILLDEGFCPKISDFGLAKLCIRKESVVSMLEARGTIGYIAPEVVSRNFGGVSHKSDVYSYGMMILEMVGGRKNISTDVSKTSEVYFPHWVYQHLVAGEDLQLEGFESQEANEISRKMIIVGLWSIQTDPLQRPAMAKVIEMLEGNLQALEIPPKPFFGSLSGSTADCPTAMELSYM